MMRTCLTFLLLSFFQLPVNLIAQHDTVLIPYRKGDRWGFSDIDGKVIITPKWDYVFPFQDQVAVVMQNRLYLIINRKGKKLSPNKFKSKPTIWQKATTRFTSGVNELSDHYIFDEQQNRIIQIEAEEIWKVSGEYVLLKNKDQGWGIQNLSAQVFLPFDFNEPVDLGNGFLALAHSGVDSTIVLNAELEIIFQRKNVLIRSFKLGVATFYDRNSKKAGLIDTTGKLVSNPVYDGIGQFNDFGVAVYGDIRTSLSDRALSKMTYGIIGIDGKKLTPPHYEHIGEFNSFGFAKGIQAQFLHPKYPSPEGVITVHGREFRHYDKVNPYPEGFALVQSDSGYAILDSVGDVCLFRESPVPPIIKEGVIWTWDAANSIQQAYDRSGNLLLTGNSNIYVNSFKTFPTTGPYPATIIENGNLGTKGGYIDAIGNWVIDPIYARFEPFQNGIAWVEQWKPFPKPDANPYHKWAGFINEKGEWLIKVDLDETLNEKTETFLGRVPYHYGELKNGYVKFEFFGKFGFWSPEGGAVQPQFSEMFEITPGTLQVKLTDSPEKRYGLMNLKGEWIVSPGELAVEYQPLHTDFITIKSGFLWGIAGMDLQEIIPPMYSYISSNPYDSTGKNPYFMVRKGLQYGLIDETGNEVLKPEFYDIKPWTTSGNSSDLWAVKKGTRSAYTTGLFHSTKGWMLHPDEGTLIDSKDDSAKISSEIIQIMLLEKGVWKNAWMNLNGIRYIDK